MAGPGPSRCLRYAWDVDADQPVIQGLRVPPLAMGEVRELPGGRVWFTLGADIATLDPSAVAALREVLRPALPVGSRTVEEYYAQPTNKWGPIIEQYVL